MRTKAFPVWRVPSSNFNARYPTPDSFARRPWNISSVERKSLSSIFRGVNFRPQIGQGLDKLTNFGAGYVTIRQNVELPYQEVQVCALSAPVAQE